MDHIESSKALRRFFSKHPLPVKGQFLLLSKAETHHLKNVLRLVAGDRCLITDGSGMEAQVLIRRFMDDECAELIVECLKNDDHRTRMLLLKVFQAMPQRGKADFLIEKAQELGVDEWAPMITERVGLRPSVDSRQKILGRWSKKIIAAAKQSGALKLTRVLPFSSFEESLASVPVGEDIVIFHPATDAVPFKVWLKNFHGGSGSTSGRTSLNLFFGPEGGFSPKEIQKIKDLQSKRKISTVLLGNTILRVETAFLAVVGALRFLLDD